MIKCLNVQSFMMFTLFISSVFKGPRFHWIIVNNSLYISWYCQYPIYLVNIHMPHFMSLFHPFPWSAIFCIHGFYWWCSLMLCLHILQKIRKICHALWNFSDFYHRFIIKVVVSNWWVMIQSQQASNIINQFIHNFGIQTHSKGGRTIKNLLVSPKDKDPMVNQNGAIYWYQCRDLGCDDEYIGETSRTFGERYKEHLKHSSAIHHHSNQTGHTTNQNNFQIIGREGHNLARNIKESIYIRVDNPTLNNNIGKFNLSHIWDMVLLNTKGLTHNKPSNNNNSQLTNPH